MMLRHIVALIFVPGFLSGCASGGLRVSSNPEQADVVVIRENGTAEKVGQTPLQIDERQISGSGKYITIVISKEGHQSESFVVPMAATGSLIQVNTKLREVTLPPICLNQSVAIDKISRGIADVQALIKQRNLAEAQGKINSLLTEYSNVSVLYDLLGNVHYMNRNLDAALASYQKSLNIDPTNADTQRMAKKLSEIVGVRKSDGRGGN